MVEIDRSKIQKIKAIRRPGGRLELIPDGGEIIDAVLYHHQVFESEDHLIRRLALDEIVQEVHHLIENIMENTYYTIGGKEIDLDDMTEINKTLAESVTENLIHEDEIRTKMIELLEKSATLR